MASKLYSKKQFTFCPLLALVVVNYQTTLIITCKNEPAKRLKQPVLRGQGRNEVRPTEDIDTDWKSTVVVLFFVEMRIARQRALTPLYSFICDTDTSSVICFSPSQQVPHRNSSFQYTQSRTARFRVNFKLLGLIMRAYQYQKIEDKLCLYYFLASGDTLWK